MLSPQLYVPASNANDALPFWRGSQAQAEFPFHFMLLCCDTDSWLAPMPVRCPAQTSMPDCTDQGGIVRAPKPKIFWVNEIEPRNSVLE